MHEKAEFMGKFSNILLKIWLFSISYIPIIKKNSVNKTNKGNKISLARFHHLELIISNNLIFLSKPLTIHL